MASEVGIVGLELVFPRRAIRQAELAALDGVAAAKYEEGLGQTEMAFCGDRDDVASLGLSALARLLRRHRLRPSALGFLEVGTETLADKSKSVKTQLMDLWKDEEELEAWSLEGVTCVNACFGGTQALFHAANWLESSAWDGRLAAVVMGDIATYGEVRSRPTGGAGAMALLLGPKAPLVLEPGLRALHSAPAWDFYKPRLDSEYPVVDGPATIRTYAKALDSCYALYRRKARARGGEELSLASFHAALFHCPYSKLVQKSLGRLAFHDHKAGRGPEAAEGLRPVLERFAGLPLEETVGERELDEALKDLSGPTFAAKTLPSLLFAKRLGNTYTSSLYAGLAAWLASRALGELGGQRALLFSFGSGFVSAMFSVRVAEGREEDLALLRDAALDAKDRLDQRVYVTAEEFEAARREREEALGRAPWEPRGAADERTHFPGDYVLQAVDDRHRRTYAQLP